MTVIRLPGGELLLHSPISATPELVSEVESLGRVAYLVAPNKLHHLYVGEWKRECRDAALYVAPGLERKRSDLEVDGVLGDAPEPGWADSVDQVLLDGFPFANEVVFFHVPSKTLVLTDLAFHIGADHPALTRAFFRVTGSVDRLAPTMLERLMVRDRAAFRRGFERMLDWPFERVVMAHGDVVEAGGREQLVEGYGWLLG